MSSQGEVDLGRGLLEPSEDSNTYANADSSQSKMGDKGDFSTPVVSGRVREDAAPLPLTGDDGDVGGAEGIHDWGRWPRRCLTLVVVVVALVCGWQVVPERAQRLGKLAIIQHRVSASVAPLPNRWEVWILDMERMLLT